MLQVVHSDFHTNFTRLIIFLYSLVKNLGTETPFLFLSLFPHDRYQVHVLSFSKSTHIHSVHPTIMPIHVTSKTKKQECSVHMNSHVPSIPILGNNTGPSQPTKHRQKTCLIKMTVPAQGHVVSTISLVFTRNVLPWLRINR